MAVFVVVVVLSCVVFTFQSENSCGIANVQVENEDGTTQVFEVKKLQPMKGDSCVTCHLTPVNSVPTLTPLQSNIVISVGEVTSACGMLYCVICTVNATVTCKRYGHRTTNVCQISAICLRLNFSAFFMCKYEVKQIFCVP